MQPFADRRHQMPRTSQSLIRTAAALAAVAGTSLAAPGPAVGAAPAPARILVKFKAGAPPAQVARVERSAGAVAGPRLTRLGVRILSVPRARVAAAIRELRRIGLVEFAERDRASFAVAARTAALIPTDPFWSREWGARAIAAPAAWATTRGSPGVVIATLDSGVDASHPDLRGALVPGFDVVNRDNDPADDNGHGTAVAGVIAARADNGIGISGICPRCALMPVKVTTAAGTATDSAVASGMTWAVDHGARVINVSLGSGSFSETLQAAVEYAAVKGAVVVSAAGNDGGSSPFYPAANEGVLSVGSTTAADRLYAWSNYGPWVDVAAPGCAFTTAAGGLYAQFCGTSASAPVVAGLVGLALAAAPAAGAVDIVAAVSGTAHPVQGLASGRVDAGAAIQFLRRRGRTVTDRSAGRALGVQPAHEAALRLTLERRRRGR